MIRQLFALGLLIGVTASWLLVFFLLWAQDEVKVVEANMGIRLFETLGMLAIFGYGVYCLVAFLRNHGRI